MLFKTTRIELPDDDRMPDTITVLHAQLTIAEEKLKGLSAKVDQLLECNAVLLAENRALLDLAKSDVRFLHDEGYHNKAIANFQELTAMVCLTLAEVIRVKKHEKVVEAISRAKRTGGISFSSANSNARIYWKDWQDIDYALKALEWSE